MYCILYQPLHRLDVDLIRIAVGLLGLAWMLFPQTDLLAANGGSADPVLSEVEFLELALLDPMEAREAYRSSLHSRPILFAEAGIDAVCETFLDRGRFEEAREAIDLKVEAFPESPNRFVYHGELKLLDGDRDGAFLDFEWSLGQYSFNTRDALDRRGWAQSAFDLDRAIVLFTANLELFPYSITARQSLADAYLLSGDLEASLWHYARLLEVLPDDEHALAVVESIVDRLRYGPTLIEATP